MYVCFKVKKGFNISKMKDVFDNTIIQIDNHSDNGITETVVLKFSDEKELLQFGEKFITLIGKGGENK